MSLTRLLAAFGLALSWLVLVPTASYACSCAESSTADHVDRADVVVRGTVEGRDAPPRGQLQSSLDPVTYTVSVAEVYKGVAAGSLEVRSVASGASCGLENVRIGREYVVFATEGTHLPGGGSDDGELWANLCGGTAPATPELVATVTAAGPGAHATTPDPSDVPTLAPAGQEGRTAGLPPDREPVGRTWPWLVAAALGAALVGVVLRRRRG